MSDLISLLHESDNNKVIATHTLRISFHTKMLTNSPGIRKRRTNDSPSVSLANDGAPSPTITIQIIETILVNSLSLYDSLSIYTDSHILFSNLLSIIYRLLKSDLKYKPSFASSSLVTNLRNKKRITF